MIDEYITNSAVKTPAYEKHANDSDSFQRGIRRANKPSEAFKSYAEMLRSNEGMKDDEDSEEVTAYRGNKKRKQVIIDFSDQEQYPGLPTSKGKKSSPWNQQQQQPQQQQQNTTTSNSGNTTTKQNNDLKTELSAAINAIQAQIDVLRLQADKFKKQQEDWRKAREAEQQQQKDDLLETIRIGQEHSKVLEEELSLKIAGMEERTAQCIAAANYSQKAAQAYTDSKITSA